MDFKFIEKDTDITALNIRPLDWDVVIKGRPFYVARIEGYMHTQGGKWGDNCYWAWPRDEEPSYENLIPFNANHVVRWGLRYEESFYTRCKWDETSIEGTAGTMITRNGKDFYLVRGDIGYSVPKAQVIITEVQEGVLNVNDIDYDKKLIGRCILYKGWPAVIALWCDGQGCICIKYAGESGKREEALKEWGCEDDTVKLDVVGYDDLNIQWFPEYIEEDEPQPKAQFDDTEIAKALEEYGYGCKKVTN